MPATVTITVRSVDMQKVATEIRRRGVAGLNGVARYAHGRAQYYAPVRELFGRPTGRKKFKGELVSEADYKRFKKSLPRFRRVDMLEGGTIYGHRNSFQPVFSYLNKAGIRVRETGDFRRLTHKGLAKVPVYTQTDPQFATHSRTRSAKPSSRGRYEVATRRAATLTGGVHRIGGTLRKSIYVELASGAQGREIWAYVVSPVHYSAPQEFGTSHNRASPFMRPALYESRRQLQGMLDKNGRPKGILGRSLGSGNRAVHGK